MKKIAFVFVLGVAFSTPLLSHGGRKDSNGGHYDRSTGKYHCHDPTVQDGGKCVEKPDRAPALVNRRADIVYGFGVSARYHGSGRDSDYVPVDRESIVPAFAVAALWDIGSAFEMGPMFVSNVNLDKAGASVSFDSVGLGLLFAFRGSSSGWINGLGIGVAYVLDQEIAYRHRVNQSLTTQDSGGSTSVVVTYSFGKGGG